MRKTSSARIFYFFDNIELRTDLNGDTSHNNADL